MEPPSRRRFNPVAFTPWPVTLITSVVYLALLIPLLVIQHVVPPAPGSDPSGVSLGEAWQDLQYLTNGFHPYNSHRNDEVHDWLLQRVHEIVASAKATSTTEDSGPEAESPDVFVFEDNQSNLTFADRGVANQALTGVYFEGTNILVYIRGSEDDKEEWWNSPSGKVPDKGGVLVNAHYDSVSTGFGATDDGVGVVSLLQLLKYFSLPSHYPRKGLVLLFNNGEEDYLNGAHVYSQHPLSRFTHTFLNLEGAGAGGRAALFRSTDTEVTKFYERAEHPFGSVLASDAFQLGYIRSQTDYVVFDGILGLRGLDVAFIEPRARYHTDQDDVRHTNLDSVWHMLSAAISTTEGMVSDTGTAFDGPATEKGKVSSGTGTRGVWFDLFGSSFAAFRLHTLFAVSVTLLVVGPLVIFATAIIISKMDRMYLFSMRQSSAEGEEKISLYGLRGMFRYPTILVVASIVTVALAYLMTKVNPFIVHSSKYAVWSMMLSLWIFLAWFSACVADFARPSALHRAYSFTWLFIITWVLLVINTVYQNQHGIAAGYFIVFYFAGTFLATWISYLEFFALPRKIEFVTQKAVRTQSSADDASSHLLAPSRDELPSDSGPSEHPEEEEPTESTSLLHGQQRTSFANYTRTRLDDEPGVENHESATATGSVYGSEQQWSAKLPTWTWLLQFILVGPIVIILVGQLALFVAAAMSQVGADGTSMLIVYINIAAFCILLLIPLSPFIHRLTPHIPIFVLLVFVGTLIYNLVAFPFSPTNRLKLSFFQEVDLDTGHNQVSLTGVDPYVRDVINAIPSSSGHNVVCDSRFFGGLHKCSWEGLYPNVVDRHGHDNNSWVSYNVSRPDHSKTKARFEISGRNTRACKLKFDSPIQDYSIAGSAVDDRLPHTSSNGVSEIRLWSRTWENAWTVDLEWDPERLSNSSALQGRVICLWSDDNHMGVIPALDEIRQYAPVWVAISKLQDGLVEASYAFSV